MREIKFRAWNKIWKMMSMVDKIEFEDGNPYSVSTTIEATDFDHTDEWSDYEVGDEIILQQFTGLKDKNGKDIYEGDIIRKSFIIRINKNNIEDLKHYHKEKLIIGEDIDDGLISEVYWDNEESEFNFGKCGLFKEWDKIEVIGNIFENPELINHPLT